MTNTIFNEKTRLESFKPRSSNSTEHLEPAFLSKIPLNHVVGRTAPRKRRYDSKRPIWEYFFHHEITRPRISDEIQRTMPATVLSVKPIATHFNLAVVIEMRHEAWSNGPGRAHISVRRLRLHFDISNIVSAVGGRRLRLHFASLVT